MVFSVCWRLFPCLGINTQSATISLEYFVIAVNALAISSSACFFLFEGSLLGFWPFNPVIIIHCLNVE